MKKGNFLDAIAIDEPFLLIGHNFSNKNHHSLKGLSSLKGLHSLLHGL